MTEQSANLAGTRVTSEPLDPELERRVAALESGSDTGSDFDTVSWLWLVLLGIVGPVALLVWGWVG